MGRASSKGRLSLMFRRRRARVPLLLALADRDRLHRQLAADVAQVILAKGAGAAQRRAPGLIKAKSGDIRLDFALWPARDTPSGPGRRNGSSHRFDCYANRNLGMWSGKRPSPNESGPHAIANYSSSLARIAAFVSGHIGANPRPRANKPDVTLGSTPDTVVWGYISSRTAAGCCASSPAPPCAI